MDWNTTAGLTAEKLAQLLAINFDPQLGADRDCRSETAGQLLDAYLASTSIIETVSHGKSRNSLEASGGAPLSLGEVLIDPQSSVDVIAEIKRGAKRMVTQQSSEAERAVATTIYFAAIASGLAVHNRKLTASPYDSLRVSLSELLDKPWMSAKLRPLLEKARRVCCDRSTQSEQSASDE
jgi:hypothetical protein